MWCAGEIVTAHRNKVHIMPVICDGFEHLDDDALQQIPDVWTQQQKHTLASFGITMEDVKAAYQHLRTLPFVNMPRFGTSMEQESAIVDILKTCNMPKMNKFAEVAKQAERPRIIITGAVADAEALAACEVFSIMVQQHLQVSCTVVRTEDEVLDAKAWASYFVVLFSRGMLRDPSFAQILLATTYDEGRQMETVTVSADTGFEFPSPEFYSELENSGLGLAGLGPERGPELAKAYRSLLSVLALPLSPLGSAGLLEKQVAEISRRFRRYRTSAVGLSMDTEVDEKFMKTAAGRTSLSMRKKEREKAQEATTSQNLKVTNDTMEEADSDDIIAEKI